MLRINVENVGAEIHLKLEGKLTGAWVTELEHCWRSCSEEFPGKAQVVDLAGTGFVDLAGKYLLTLMHQNGVRLIARSPWMNELVEEIAHSGAGKRSGS
jgi:hypothetical protein